MGGARKHDCVRRHSRAHQQRQALVYLRQLVTSLPARVPSAVYVVRQESDGAVAEQEIDAAAVAAGRDIDVRDRAGAGCLGNALAVVEPIRCARLLGRQ
jgi:hypothetical protein